MNRIVTSVLTCVAVIAISASVFAAPIPVDVTITGDVTYDTGFSFSDPGAAHAGTMIHRVGGADTTQDVADGDTSPTGGTNPLMGTFTDTGDGLGIDTFTASATGPAGGAEFNAAFDLVFSLTNSSVTDTYEVVFGVTRTNVADANQNGSGTDGYIDGEFTIDQGVTEVFFSQVESDVLFGDALNGVPQGTFGALITDSGTSAFTVTLIPGATISIDGVYTIVGETFSAVDNIFGSFDGFIVINEVNNITTPQAIPEPGTWALMGIGLLAVGGAARRRKKRAARTNP